MRSSWCIQDSCTFSKTKRNKRVSTTVHDSWTIWSEQRTAYLVSVTEADVIVETVRTREGSITEWTIVLLAFLHAARIGRRSGVLTAAITAITATLVLVIVLGAVHVGEQGGGGSGR